MKVTELKVKMVPILLFIQTLCVTVRVAFYTLLERKFLGYVQQRKGPNKPGIQGLFVPFADALKLLTKEYNTPTGRNKSIYHLVPILALMIPILLYCVYPVRFESLTFQFSSLWFICVSSVGVYAVIGAGWGSNRKYSIIGALRAVAQSISYEVSLALLVIHCFLFFNYSLMIIKLSVLRTFLYLTITMLLLTALAETNRAPFDFTEGESELVRGFNTEFRSVSFLMIFLAEYISILFISTIIRVLFLISAYLDLFFYLICCAVIFIWCRGTLPRLRYDQLIYIAWKSFLPIVMGTMGMVLMA